jgi:hypothetical protein
MTELNLERNQLEGDIPVEIGHLTRLTTLKLGNNRLRGIIPHEIGNLICLEILDPGSQGCRGYGLATEGGLTGFGTSQSCSASQTSETSMLYYVQSYRPNTGGNWGSCSFESAST